MTILLAAGTPHLPQVRGGVEVNTHELALALNRRGHEAAVLSKLSPRDPFGALRCLWSFGTRSDIVVDTGLGYPVYRSRQPWSRLRGLPLPRVAVINNGNMVKISHAFRRLGVPSIAYLHGLEFEGGRSDWEGTAESLPFSAYIAISRYAAGRLRAKFGIEAVVIPPVFHPERYRSQGERKFVTFVNPVPEKGVELAIAVAALCPEIPFRFVKGWPLSLRAKASLRFRLALLPNVTLCEWKVDMVSVYAATRVLMAPSQWQAETWGRVASEAQFSGIPVLGSDRGGLPEAIGAGGTVLPHDTPPAIWADELRRLYHDHEYRARKSDAALAHSRRPEIDLDRQVEVYLGVIRRVIG